MTPFVVACFAAAGCWTIVPAWPVTFPNLDVCLAQAARLKAAALPGLEAKLGEHPNQVTLGCRGSPPAAEPAVPEWRT